MNSTPKISIIVPVYNVEKYISKCIDSVLAQTYKDYELILVDDGSTDNSGKICEEYALKDNRIKVIHKINEGLVNARKSGVEISIGNFLYHIDGDDYITQNALELFINKQKENDADIVRGSFCSENQEYKRIKEYIITPVHSSLEYLNYIYHSSAGTIWNILIKKDIYIKYVDVPNYITLGEDLIANLQLIAHTKTINYVEKITYIYLQREGSMMKSRHNNNKTYYKNLLLIKELNKIFLKYQKEGMNNYSKILEYIIYNRLFLNLMDNKAHIKEHKKEVFKLYIKYFALNRNVQSYILKNSWKCYLSNWWSITKFIC